MSKDKIRTHYVCQNCGSTSPRWQGRCPACEAWNTFVEEIKVTTTDKRSQQKGPPSTAIPLDQIRTDDMPRLQTISPEFNRVLGGGVVHGSVVLIGGDPGIGKSTLLLQEATGLSRADFPVLYVTGEESAQQTKMRAQRLGLSSSHLFVLAETELESILNVITQTLPRLVVVDSIQTLFTPLLQSVPGSVSQVRECALRLIQVAKKEHIPIFLIGHVTKEGLVAGPKVLEHMVDALLLFEGDRDQFYRILRAAKNRFGSTREIGVFEMTERGLRDVPDPSRVFLSERRLETSGSSVICCMEGTRPILLEIQALVSPSNYGYSQRNTTGFDLKRIQMLLAVLEKRLGYHVGSMDVYVNAVGGFRVDETAADLGVVACIASSMRNRVIDNQAILIGEIGLGGELRAVSHIEARLSEAEKMGFQRAVIPRGNKKQVLKSLNIHIFAVDKVEEALETVLQ